MKKEANIFLFLFILFGLILVGIVFFLIFNFNPSESNQSTESLELDNIELIVKNAYEENGSLFVEVENSLEESLDQVKVILTTDDGVEEVFVDINLDKNGAKVISIPLGEHSFSQIKSISAFSAGKGKSQQNGNEDLNSDDDSFFANSVSAGSGGSGSSGNSGSSSGSLVNSSINSTCVSNCSNLQCGFDLVCGESCGECASGSECIQGVCILAETCVDECKEGISICMGTSFSRLCGNYDSDSCLELGTPIVCSSFCDLGECVEAFYESVTIGKNYNMWRDADYFTQATVEEVNLSDYVGKIFVVDTITSGNEIELAIYKGVFNQSRMWWDIGPLYSSVRDINPNPRFYLDSGGIYSIVYLSRPKENNVVENLSISRSIRFLEPYFQVNLSKKVLVDFSGFPWSDFQDIDSPSIFVDNLNDAYEAYVNLTGYESPVLNNGHIKLVFDTFPACGYAGNPIRINKGNKACIPVEEYNQGQPSWAPVHELGHDFITQSSLNDLSDVHSFAELWANILAYYTFDIDLYGVQHPFYTREQFRMWKNQMYPVKDQLFEIDKYEGVSVLAAMHEVLMEIKDKYGWQVYQKFFRKYENNPYANLSQIDKRKMIVKNLADSAKEITGKQEDYDFVVNKLVEWDFPIPD